MGADRSFILAEIKSLGMSFDGQPYLALVEMNGERYCFALTDDQLHLLARQALKLTFEHYNLVRPEGQS